MARAIGRPPRSIRRRHTGLNTQNKNLYAVELLETKAVEETVPAIQRIVCRVNLLCLIQYDSTAVCRRFNRSQFIQTKRHVRLELYRSEQFL